MDLKDTICALSTPPGTGAISLVRISGVKTMEILYAVFESKTHKQVFEPYRIYLGFIRDGIELIDEVLISFFQKPHSFTGEDMVEISCHGSTYIQKSILELLIRKGCRLAEPGEFSMRSFLNGKMDLSQAEAISDLIASQSKAAHQLALHHLRGGFSNKIKDLREQLLHFAALLELELDFAEEDVEFANRSEVSNLLIALKTELSRLIDSFTMGNVFKNGIPVAIVGKPNVGKSTLLNTLLNEDRAIVSEIPGTTRDTIEDCINIHGFIFRFIDTAGIRNTLDEVEMLGIERTYKAIEQAMFILYLIDKEEEAIDEMIELSEKYKEKKILFLVNKSDLLKHIPISSGRDILYISAKKKINISLITNELQEYASELYTTGETLVSNTRHYEALLRARESLLQAEHAFEKQLSTEFIMVDIRQVLYYLGTIVGEITNDEILRSIFSRFCIGK
ncbi:MAG: tRNA uridine-5-carboxymethylaminomethyl(34) synthesis GTPase MnmE [Bacteroidales bacterium]|nr:tRNA uridine-5-carboxymethylaminomethyl(34) synthesis GTPase MnmE [Bacteroidales bacterium]